MERRRHRRRNAKELWGRPAIIAAALVTVVLTAGPASAQTAGNKGAEAATARESSVFRPSHPYDPSAPELMLPLPTGLREWTPPEIESEVRARVSLEKRRGELDVYYYRIGYTIAYPLPLAAAPPMDALPVGIRGITYPWYTWLSWSLEERWRLLHAAWRRFGDREAGARLQKELAALAGWTQSCEVPGSASLATAHIAGCLSMALAGRDGWDPALYEKARSAAGTILERDVWPWFDRQWPEGREITARELQNIRVITLARSAELARVVGSPQAAALRARVQAALRAWYRFRLGKPPYTEGSAYDGFLMDSLTGWLGGEPARDALLAEGREAFASLAEQWIQLGLPGRADAQAPLGDVEPEMPFWMTALGRLASWYGRPDARWLTRRLPPGAMPAALLVDMLEYGGIPQDSNPPKAGLTEHPHAISLRTGWDAPDLLAAVGLTRGEAGHLHTDAGQVVLGWQGRFWITDPGYQQYRPGAEREYSIGPEAHNVPVIVGRTPSKRAPRLVARSRARDGGQRIDIDLSGCYEGLPGGASVERDIGLLPGAAPAVVVRDRFRDLGAGAEVRTSWHGGTHLAWSFRKGKARLSDGEHALWIGAFPGIISAAALDRHEGSRGPLTLHDKTELPDGKGDRYWIFIGDPGQGGEPPVEMFEKIVQDWDSRSRH